MTCSTKSQDQLAVFSSCGSGGTSCVAEAALFIFRGVDRRVDLACLVRWNGLGFFKRDKAPRPKMRRLRCELVSPLSAAGCGGSVDITPSGFNQNFHGEANFGTAVFSMVSLLSQRDLALSKPKKGSRSGEQNVG